MGGEKSYVEVVKSHSVENFSSKDPPVQKIATDKSPFISSYWVHKDYEVLSLDFDNLWVVTGLFAHNDWKEIKVTLENYFQSNVLNNPLFDDKA